MWFGQNSLRRAWVKALKSRRLFVWCVILAIVAGVLATLPLFGVLGYEFSFVIAIVGCIAAFNLSANWVNRARHVRRPSEEQIPSAGALTFALVLSGCLLSLVPLIPALVIISLNAFRVTNCDWFFGFHAFLVMPMLSAVLASILSLTIALWMEGKGRLAFALCILLALASVALSLFHFYNNPAVFSYNPIVGFFPGNLYDESIAFEAPFYWARLLHVSLALAALGWVAFFLDTGSLRLTRHRCPKGTRAWALLFFVASVIVASVCYARSGTLGFLVKTNDVNEALPGRFETDHFIIRYPLGGVIERDIQLIAEDHEFRLSQVANTLGATPARKITSYYFDSAATKHRLMGARNVYMAKPWRSEIYINHAPFPHPVLRHEIAHVVSGEFGSALFKVSASGPFDLPIKFNVGLIEGIAVAADWPDRFSHSLTPHQNIRALIELDMLPPVETLFSTGFFAFSSSRSYTVSGSFVRYLLETYGIDPLQKVYANGGDFSSVYPKPEKTLIQEWYDMVSSIELPKGAAEVVRERFRRESIFKRPCPHAVAKARLDMATLESKGLRQKAIKIADKLCDAVPKEPAYQIHRNRLRIRAGQTIPALASLQDIVNRSETVSSHIRSDALLIMVRESVRNGNTEKADQLLELAQSLPLDDGKARLINVSRLILNHQGPALPALLSYLWGHHSSISTEPSLYLARAARALHLEPDLPLAHYLLARQLFRKGDPAATSQALMNAVELGLPRLIEREAARMLAASAYQANNRDYLDKAIAILGDAKQPEVVRLYAADWMERLEWKETHQ